jgi:hypothetical protein
MPIRLRRRLIFPVGRARRHGASLEASGPSSPKLKTGTRAGPPEFVEADRPCPPPTVAAGVHEAGYPPGMRQNDLMRSGHGRHQPAVRRLGGISWSPWLDFDQARDDRLIPSTPGLYRFRAQHEESLLYIGESQARWDRLDDLARARRRHTADYYLQGHGDPSHSSAPYFIICECPWP